MDVDIKIEILARALKELMLAMDPEDMGSITRYNILKDLDRILNDIQREGAEDR
jgi:hypothetical protein